MEELGNTHFRNECHFSWKLDASFSKKHKSLFPEDLLLVSLKIHNSYCKNLSPLKLKIGLLLDYELGCCGILGRWTTSFVTIVHVKSMIYEISLYICLQVSMKKDLTFIYDVSKFLMMINAIEYKCMYELRLLLRHEWISSCIWNNRW